MSQAPVNEQTSTTDSEFIEVQRFLTREAALLDQRQYAQWLRMLADTIKYRVTACAIREAGLGNLHYAIIDEDMAGLRSRVDQISNPKLTRAENPPTLTRRLISNVDVQRLPDGGYEVRSNVLIYRSRPGYPEGALYVGARTDILQRVKQELRIARRQVDLDQQVLTDGGVSTLF